MFLKILVYNGAIPIIVRGLTMIENKSIVETLYACGFKKLENKNLYVKEFSNYQISADLDRNIIDYGNEILFDRKTTTNFNKSEQKSCRQKLLD